MNDRKRRRRKNLRLPSYDYRRPGAYFITICAFEMRRLFGEVVDSTVQLNAFGKIVQQEWLRTAEIRAEVRLDAFVVTPNHFHGILLIDAIDPTRSSDHPGVATHRVATTGRGTRSRRGPASGSVGAIVGQFKSHSARRINRLRDTPGAPVWKPNYYEHIIRSDRSLDRIRDYIQGNPAKWVEDRYVVNAAVVV